MTLPGLVATGADPLVISGRASGRQKAGQTVGIGCSKSGQSLVITICFYAVCGDEGGRFTT